MTRTEEWRARMNSEYKYRSEEEGLNTYRGPAFDAAIKLLSELKFDTVLDVGCGPGKITSELYKKFPKVRMVGVDISDIQISKALKSYENLPITFIRSDFLDFYTDVVPNSSDGFDLIICWSVLLHVPPDRVESFVSRLKFLSRRYILLANPEWSVDSSMDGVTQWHHGRNLFSDWRDVSHWSIDIGPSHNVFHVYLMERCMNGREEHVRQRPNRRRSW